MLHPPTDQFNPKQPANAFNLANAIRLARVAKGLTQREIGEAFNISSQAVNQWETGANEPSAGRLLNLVALLGMDLFGLVAAQTPTDLAEVHMPHPDRAGQPATQLARPAQVLDRQQEPGPQDDAALIGLVTKLVEADRRRKLLFRKCDELYEYVEVIAAPLALAWRPSDTPNVCMSPSESCATYVFGEQDCFCYENGVEDLSLWAQSYALEGDTYVNNWFSDQDRVRTREIIAAHADWQAAQRRAEDAAGYTKQSEGANQETKIIEGLLRQIASTPARTLPGLGAKAQAAAIAEHRTVASLKEQWLPILLADAGTASHEMLTVSLLIDVASVGAGGAA